jgi:hypothetical protein
MSEYAFTVRSRNKYDMCFAYADAAIMECRSRAKAGMTRIIMSIYKGAEKICTMYFNPTTGMLHMSAEEVAC